MIRTAWRIVKSAHARAAFDGEGARLFGGRWNSPGTRVVYTAESESLATLELLVHLQQTRVLTTYSAIPLRFDDALVERVAQGQLPRDWTHYPAPAGLQQIGDRWATELRSAVLQVPSAVVTSEHCFVLNPQHRDFGKLKIERARPFRLDPRLRPGGTPPRRSP